MPVTAPESGGPSPIRPEILDACRQALRRMGGPSLGTVGVTSCGRREGRSTIAAAIATVQAQDHATHTALVELDLVRPSASARFGLERAPGVREFARNNRSMDECLQWPSERLGVVVAGGSDRGVAERVSVASIVSLLDDLTLTFDNVVVDLPPLEPGEGAPGLLAVCHTVVLVVKAGAVSRQRVASAAEFVGDRAFVILNGCVDPVPRWVQRLLGTGR